MDNLSNIEDRLKRLKKDLCITKADTSDFYTELMQVYQDKRDSIIDIYAKLYSPASTSLREEGYSSDPLCSGTMTQRMLAFSSGYDNFIEGIEERYRGEIMRKRQALDIILQRCCHFLIHRRKSFISHTINYRLRTTLFM
ncbi:MAG: hypothetical protein LKM40_07715 [Mageeibacillus sp.]|jgi:hypothetical protein|nr:hypothetical protein [Mageeibacillus sp.]